jgi:phospholipid transport system substrate-binding protein
MMEYWSIGVMGPKPNTPSLQYRITPTRWSDVRGTRRENPWEEIMSKFSASTVIKMIQQRRVATVGGLFLLCCILLPSSPLRAGAPTEQVRATVDKVLAIVRNPNLKPEAQKEDLQAQLAQVIYPRFDFTEMAKRSLGPHWGRRTAEEQREFVKIFAALLGRTYTDRIESYTSQTIVYTREIEDKEYAEVDTKIITDKREEVSINYKLHSIDNEWKVYDLVIEDISVVNNYRSQFDRVIARSSFEELVRVMKEKQS